MKPGDKVKCISKDARLTVGNIYTLVEVPANHLVGSIKPLVAVDHGANGGGVWSYYASCFELETPDRFETLKKLVALAETMINTTVTTKSRDLRVTKYEIFLDRDLANKSSNSVLMEFDRSGFCVAVQGNQRSIPVQEVNVKPVEVKLELTKDYDAIVTKDAVQVGCQVIPREKLLELVKTMETLQG